MQTVMYTDTIFGPIHSRRLGTSLGVNLSPRDGKICSFDCLYCEAGLNEQGKGTTGMPSQQEVSRKLEKKLMEMLKSGQTLDTITFSGNGEPTIHPQFENIIKETIALRDKYFPKAKVSVLTNSTNLASQATMQALREVDNPILKIDSAIDETVRKLDRPVNENFEIKKIIENIAKIGPKAIIQTMFTKNESVDNTTEREIDALIEAYKTINPGKIMIYSLDRPTPDKTLKKISADRLAEIADKIFKTTGIEVMVAI